jgi:hypothetical protein
MIVYVVWVDRRFLGLPVLAFLAVGCVSLDKPSEVQACAATGTCSNEPSKVLGEDARRDVKSSLLDLASDKNVARDAGLLATKPDLASDVATPDLGTGNNVWDSLAGAEDGAPDKSSAPAPANTEPANGPEPGPEPAMTPEPRPEPSAAPEPGPDASREPGPEISPDTASSDLALADSCTIFYGATPSSGSAGHPPSVNTLSAFCIATCDDIDGWGCANFDGRTISVNGTPVSCGATVTKKNGFYVFRASAGTLSFAAIYWWGPQASTCAAPASGVFP